MPVTFEANVVAAGLSSSTAWEIPAMVGEREREANTMNQTRC